MRGILYSPEMMARPRRLPPRCGSGRFCFGRRRWRRLIAAVSLCDFVLSTDGGPMHIAAALDIPQVALFGATDPDQWAPVSQRGAVLFGKGRVDRISVEEVMKTTAAVMAGGSGRSAARFPDTMQAVPKGEG